MGRTRKQRLLDVLALVVLFGTYVGWSKRPHILLHYSGQASAPIVYSYKEQDVETFSGEIRSDQVREFPVKLFGGSDYRITFFFHRGEKKYASFNTKLGWGTLGLYVDTELSVSIQPPPESLVQQQWTTFAKWIANVSA